MRLGNKLVDFGLKKMKQSAQSLVKQKILFPVNPY